MQIESMISHDKSWFKNIHMLFLKEESLKIQSLLEQGGKRWRELVFTAYQVFLSPFRNAGTPGF